MKKSLFYTGGYTLKTVPRFFDTTEPLVQIGAGDYYVYETIDFDKISGIKFQGMGQAYYPKDHPTDGAVTRLIWKGDPSVPMFRGPVRHGLFQDIQFVGGYLQIMPIRGFGTGLCNFERCTFFNSGVKFGDNSYNANAADSTFRDCQFVNCKTACVELSTSQNVNYLIDNCMFYRCANVVNVRGGGLVTLRDCYLTQIPTVFKIIGDGSKTGSHNGNFVVRDLRYDWKQDVKPTIVNDISGYGSGRKLIVDNVHSPRGVSHVKILNSEKVEWEVRVR